MIERLIHYVFTQRDHRWHLKGGKEIVPSENDVEEALDEAARILYTRDIGDQLNVGGLIIEKRPIGHDVYVYVGNYQ